MGKRRLELAELLRVTAARLSEGAVYRWTHQGRCNCGHLAQTLTGMESSDIHRLAIQSEGEWSDHAAAYCETSGMPVDDMITKMLAFGITIEELGDLERLASPTVTRWLPATRAHLDYRNRMDVVLYFETWAAVLDARQAWEQDPDTPIQVNGKTYQPYEARRQIPVGLDENPAGGRAA